MISLMLDISQDAGLGVDFHVDETLDSSMLSLRDLAKQLLMLTFPIR